MGAGMDVVSECGVTGGIGMTEPTTYLPFPLFPSLPTYIHGWADLYTAFEMNGHERHVVKARETANTARHRQVSSWQD